MSAQLRVVLIIMAVIIIVVIFRLIKSKKLPVKYSLFWLIASVIILLVGAVPNLIGIFTRLIGFETSSNLVIGIILMLLLIITLLLTIIVSNQRKRITVLVQEVSHLKKRVNDYEK